MIETTRFFYLPDTLKDWPWPRKIHQQHEEVKREADAWFKSLRILTPEAQGAFDRYDNLLTVLCHINLSKEQLRTACDMMNFLFLYDDYTDNANADLARHYADILIDALRNPFKKRPEGESILGTVAQQIWARGVKTASATSQRHFLEGLIEYLESVVQQAECREFQQIPSVEEYFELRHRSVGIYEFFCLLEQPYDLPDHVSNHPVVKDLVHLAIEIILLDNDLVSYNKEQATEEMLHNSIAIIMHHSQCNLQQAVDEVVRMSKKASDAFLARWKDIPQWDPPVVSDMATDYLEGVANWVRGNNTWGFEGGRYFGDKGKVIQKTRIVKLLPKRRLGLEGDEKLKEIDTLFTMSRL